MAKDWWSADAVSESSGDWWTKDKSVDDAAKPAASPADVRRVDNRIEADADTAPQEVVTSSRPWNGAGAGRGGLIDSRRLDVNNGYERSVKVAAIEKAVKELRGINPGASDESLYGMASAAYNPTTQQVESPQNSGQNTQAYMDTARENLLRQQEMDRIKANANENPITSSLASGLLSAATGVANAPQALVNAPLEYIDKVGGALTGSQINTPKLSKWGFTKDAMDMASAASPDVAGKELGQSIQDGDFATMLMSNLAQSAPSSALSVASMFAPPLRAALLPSMGVMSAGQSYAQGDSAIASVLKGGIEMGTEMLPLGVFDKARDFANKLPMPVRQEFAAVVARKIAQAGGEVSATAMSNFVEEAAAQFGGNLVDRAVQGKTGDLSDGVLKAGVIGMAAGAAHASPAIAQRAFEPGSKQAVIEQALAGKLSQPAMVSFSDPSSPAAQAGITPVMVQLNPNLQSPNVSTPNTPTGVVAGTDVGGGNLSSAGLENSGRVAADGAGLGIAPGVSVADSGAGQSVPQNTAQPTAAVNPIARTSDSALLSRIPQEAGVENDGTAVRDGLGSTNAGTGDAASTVSAGVSGVEVSQGRGVQQNVPQGSPESIAARESAQRNLDHWHSVDPKTHPKITLGTPAPEADAQIQGAIKQTKEVFGTTANVVAFSDPSPDSVNGIQISNTLYVNTKGLTSNALNTGWHETHHIMQAQAEADTRNGKVDTQAQRYVTKVDSIFDTMGEQGKRSYIENFLYKGRLKGLTGAKREAAIQAALEAPETRKEMMADFVGNRATDRGFIKSLAQADKANFGQWAKNWLNTINTLIDELRGKGGKSSKAVDGYVANLKEAKATLRDALIELKNSGAKGLEPTIVAASKGVPAYQRQERPNYSGKDYDGLGNFNLDFTSDDYSNEPMSFNEVSDVPELTWGRFGSRGRDGSRMMASQEGYGVTHTEEGEYAVVDPQGNEVSREYSLEDAQQQAANHYAEQKSARAELVREQEARRVAAAETARRQTIQRSITEPTAQDIKDAGLNAENAVKSADPTETDRGNLFFDMPRHINGGASAKADVDGDGKYSPRTSDGTTLSFVSTEDGKMTKEGAIAYIKRQIAGMYLNQMGHDINSTYRKGTILKIAQKWTEFAQAENTFKFGDANSRTTDFIDLSKEKGLFKKYDLDEVGGTLIFTRKSDGRRFNASVSERRGRVEVCTMGLKESDIGTAFYSVMGQVARNKGLKFDPDDMLSTVNTYRRTEQAFSFAIKTGDSGVLLVGPQNRVYGYNKNPITKEDHQKNIARLALANYRNVKELIPAMDSWRYDSAADTFVDSRGNSVEEKIDALLGNKDKGIKGDKDIRALGVGRSTLARAVLTRQIIHNDEMVDGVTKFNKPVAYSRKEEDFTSLGEHWGDPAEEGSNKVGLNPDFETFIKDSEVVDSDGKPMVVYHGTNANIEEFGGWEWAGWFSKEPSLANDYTYPMGEKDFTGPNVMPVFVSIKNPLRIDVDMNDPVDSIKPLLRKLGLDDVTYNDYGRGPNVYRLVNSDKFAKAVQELGYDGIIVKEGGVETYAPAQPTQIKSAIGNNGQFDATNPNINYKRKQDSEDDVPVRVYTPEQKAKALEEKFGRMREFHVERDGLMRRIERDAIAGKEEAIVLRLIAHTGFRIGGGTTDGKPTYGASTLKPEHVTVKGDVVSFEFTGKSGVLQKHSIENAPIARDIAKRIGRPSLFSTADRAIRKYKDAIPELKKYKVHDFRTWQATKSAMLVVEDLPQPTNLAEYRGGVELALSVAAAKIGDTLATTKEHYVDPKIFDAWRKSAGVKDESEVQVGTGNGKGKSIQANDSEDGSGSDAEGVREVSFQRKEAPLFFGDRWITNQSEFGSDLKSPITLSDKTRLDGFTDRAQTTFKGYDKNGERISLGRDSVNPDDVVFSRDGNKTAKAVADALRQVVGPAYKRKQTAAQGLPEETGMQGVQRVMQDKYNRVLMIQNLIAERGGVVGEEQNVYRAEERMHGRVHENLREFADEVVHPLIKKAVDFGVDLNELAAYSYAKHAVERNAHIQQTNKNVKTGSGMSDAEAANIIQLVELSNDKAKFEELHNDLLAITATTRRLMLDEGLITQDQYDGLENQYENYVPLRGFEDVDPDSGSVRPGLGRGFQTKGKETIAAMGRDSKAGDIIENIIRDYERITIRAERNAVGKTFLDLVTSNPDPKLWEVQPMTRATRKVNGLVQYVNVEDKGEDTISVKVAGQQVYIKINDPLLLRAMQNTFKAETSDAERFLTRTLGTYTSLLRNTITRYNPAFGIINAVRDSQMGAAGVFDELGAEGLRRYTMNYGPAAMASGRVEFNRTNSQTHQMDKWMREMRFAGGTTGGVFMRDHETIAKELRDAMLQAGARPDGVIEFARSTKLWAGATHVMHGLELIGSMSENTARLAAYATAREMGKTPAQAASIAKNLTVNFNRFGEQGQLINTAFLFYNASVQGSVRIFQMLKNPKVQAAMVGVTSVGLALAMMAAAVGGDDEDGEAYWDKIPDFEKERNLIIMLPPGTDSGAKVGTHGRYIKIPMAYGLNVFPVLGYQLADLARNIKDPARGIGFAKAGINMLSAVAGSYNPAGGSFDPRDKTQLALAVSPTVVDAGIQLYSGVNGFGQKLGPEKSSFDKRPDSETVSAANHGRVEHRIARWLNDHTGGNQARSGAIDIEPGTIKNLEGIMGGGLGKFVGDVLNLGYMGNIDAPIKPRDIPVYKAFYGEYDSKAGMSKFYERSQAAKKEFDDMKDEFKLGIKREYSDEEKFLQGMGGYADSIGKAMGELKKWEVSVAESNKTDKEKEFVRRDIQRKREMLAEQFNKDWYARESKLKRQASGK